MRTVNFRDDIVYGIAQLLGIDPTIDLPPDRARQLVSFANSRVRYAWELWDFPELAVTEERAFRSIWNATKTFYRAGTNGLPDELFYIPNMTYYRVKGSAPTDPVAGTLPTNTTYFEAMDAATGFDRYVEYDQPCRRAIGQVYGIYGANPRLSSPVPGLDFRPSEKGIDVWPWFGGPTVFVYFKTRPSKFTYTAYAAGSYKKGDLVLWTDGNCYRAIIDNTNVSPTSSSAWAVVPMPYSLAEFVKLGTAADAADDAQTSAKLDGEAQALLYREIDKLLEQGQRHFYRTGDRRRRRLEIPYGVSGFWWSVSAPWSGSTVTTLTDVCQDEYGTLASQVSQRNTETGLTALISGQDYIDIVFATEKKDGAGNPTTEWNFSQLEVESTVEPPSLKIWAVTVSNRASTGCRVYLNDAPDTGNFKLRWGIS